MQRVTKREKVAQNSNDILAGVDLHPWIGRSLRKLVKEQAPNVCFLMETQLDREGFDKLYG